MSRVTVVVADDHLVYRQGLASLLRRSGIDVLGEAPNGEAAIAAVRACDPDVVVMDLNMPGVSGLQATRRLVGAERPGRALVLTVSAQGEDLDAAIASGAMGYLLKDSPIEEVVTAIRAAAAAPRPSPSPCPSPPAAEERPARGRLLRRILD